MNSACAHGHAGDGPCPSCAAAGPWQDLGHGLAMAFDILASRGDWTLVCAFLRYAEIDTARALVEYLAARGHTPPGDVRRELVARVHVDPWSSPGDAGAVDYSSSSSSTSGM